MEREAKQKAIKEFQKLKEPLCGVIEKGLKKMTKESDN